ncbi:MAG TPA: glycosyltransferase [Dermatophilaceae bacterium]
MPLTVRHPVGVSAMHANVRSAVRETRARRDPHRPSSIGLLSTYPPTQCGLATFSAALREHLDRPSGSVGVVRVVDQPESHPGREVVAHLVNGPADSASRAAEHLNSFDAVLIQHEYGIYGGPDGVDVLDIVDALTVPTIIVFHTVLKEPTPRQFHILQRLLHRADVVVTMTETAKRRLVGSYAAEPAKVTVIPHGAVDHGPVRVQRRSTDRPLILTWGLLGPGKGIEWAIDAMPGLRDLRPRYLVIGKTHPKVLERDNEDYRNGLVRRAELRGVSDIVEFDDSYLEVSELADLVERADVVLLPYDSREQVTSGVLIEAVAAGRPVVSTAFPHAIELLTDGPGLVVPQRDAASLEVALRRVLSEPGLADTMSAQAVQKAPDLLWGAVAGRYRQLAEALVSAALVASP